MPYGQGSAFDSLLTNPGLVNQGPGLASGTPTGYPFPPTPLTDQGDSADFYNNAYTWEPKRQHQFILLDSGIPAYLIKTSAKPSLTNGEITLDHINVKRYVKGKTAWNSIAIQIYDAIIPSAAQSVMQWVRLHHESVSGRDGYSTQYKKDLKLRQLSPIGEVIEEWTLYGCYLQEANFGSLDWGAEDVVMIDATLRYDWAFLNY